MGAQPRISGAQLLETLTAHRGNVSAAADASGMSRNNFYRRVAVLGVDVEALRKGGKGATIAVAGGIVARGRVTRPPSLGAEKCERLREAKFDLQARYRADMTESDILDRFFDDAFEGWLQAKLAAGAAK